MKGLIAGLLVFISVVCTLLCLWVLGAIDGPEDRPRIRGEVQQSFANGVWVILEYNNLNPGDSVTIEIR